MAMLRVARSLALGGRSRVGALAAAPVTLRRLASEAAAAVDSGDEDDKAMSGPTGATGRQTARFADFALPEPLVERLKEHKYDATFGIQEKTLRLALAGSDILGKAQTGSGKTLAFLVPMLQHIYARRQSGDYSRMIDGNAPLGLVLAPTRELALQIQSLAERLAPSLNIRSVCVYGGAPIAAQQRLLRSGCDLLIGTPGRLIDHMKNSGLDLKRVSIVAIDEADEMLSSGFFDDVMEIVDGTRDDRQLLLFSATVPAAARQLASRFMKNPQEVQLGEEMPSRVAHQAIAVNRSEEVVPVVGDVILKVNAPRTIVFCNTRLKVTQTAEHLARLGIKAAPLHSDLSQDIREFYMKRFRSGELRVLVATDVASRGIDIPDCDLVVNVEFPAFVPESYVHRTGRTGRAGRAGTAVTVYSPGDKVRSTTNMLQRLVNLQFVQPPSQSDVMRASVIRIKERLADVPADDRAIFADAAKEMVDEGDAASLLSAALVLISGVTKRAPMRPLPAKSTRGGGDRDRDRDSHRDHGSGYRRGGRDGRRDEHHHHHHSRGDRDRSSRGGSGGGRHSEHREHSYHSRGGDRDRDRRASGDREERWRRRVSDNDFYTRRSPSENDLF